MTKAILKPCVDPLEAYKKMSGIDPDKWVVIIPQKAPYEDDIFGYYVTKAEALVDVARYDLTLGKDV